MKALPFFAISTLSRAARDASAIGATKVLSIIDPEDQAPQTPAAMSHGVLRFHDVEGVVDTPRHAPSSEHVAEIIAFARTLTSNDRCLVHCHAGISRSPAAVLIMVAALTQAATEAVSALREIEPAASYDPNPLMIHLADQQLRLDGSLVAAVDVIRAAAVLPAADQIW